MSSSNMRSNIAILYSCKFSFIRSPKSLILGLSKNICFITHLRANIQIFLACRNTVDFRVGGFNVFTYGFQLVSSIFHHNSQLFCSHSHFFIFLYFLYNLIEYKMKAIFFLLTFRILFFVLWTFAKSNNFNNPYELLFCNSHLHNILIIIDNF